MLAAAHFGPYLVTFLDGDTVLVLDFVRWHGEYEVVGVSRDVGRGRVKHNKHTVGERRLQLRVIL